MHLSIGKAKLRWRKQSISNLLTSRMLRLQIWKGLEIYFRIKSYQENKINHKFLLVQP